MVLAMWLAMGCLADMHCPIGPAWGCVEDAEVSVMLGLCALNTSLGLCGWNEAARRLTRCL
eukprot:2547673-Amphidinium_carterae.1